MSDASQTEQPSRSLTAPILYALSVFFVIMGMVNAMPGIPGLDDLAKEVTGNPNFAIRKWPFEYYYPFAFSLMMLIVVLKHSMWRSWKDRSNLRRGFGLFMDVALLLMAFTISLTYLVEIDSVCMIDTLNGERARLIAESLRIEKENALIFGLPEPTTVDDPKCVNTTGPETRLLRAGANHRFARSCRHEFLRRGSVRPSRRACASSEGKVVPGSIVLCWLDRPAAPAIGQAERALIRRQMRRHGNQRGDANAARQQGNGAGRVNHFKVVFGACGMERVADFEPVHGL